ncbi:MAG TPA: porin [Gemmatimonadaceae bacterium]|nr:porin [Gemmatimonadaceae bacterium]
MQTMLRTAVCVFGLSIPPALPAQQSTPPPRDSALALGLAAGESAAEPKRRRLVDNDLDLGFTTFHFGAGYLIDVAAFAQNEASKEQFQLEPAVKVRDARLIFRGRFNTSRPITWQTGLMYDGLTGDWFVRQTGIMVAVPEIWSHFFIGRAKEGVSLNRVMVGYDGWTIERFPFSETIPLLADGIKWLGYLPNRHLIWNLGVFTDWLSEGESFSTYDHQLAARVAWVPMVSDSAGKLLHIGVNARGGKVNDGQLQIRARPEAHIAPYFVDTEKFPAGSARQVGLEAYYRAGPLLIGSEYYLQAVNSSETGDPRFHGGDVAVTWLFTGETRSYNTVGGYFRAVSPTRTVFEGGPGALEGVLRVSYTDLNSEGVEGGIFWRITPMLNWHLSDHVRLELVYGYGSLDRFDVEGATQFFQSRLQLAF